MAHDIDTADRQAVREHLASRGWSLNKLATESKVAYSTLHAWLHGNQGSLQVKTATKLAGTLGISLDTLLGAAKTPANINCVGKVGAGEIIRMLDADDVFPVPTPPGLKAGRKYEALQICGRSMHPAQPGWLVFYETEPANPEDCLNHACVVETENGAIFFKVLRRYGDSQDRFTLESWTAGEPPIEGVRIKRCQRFAALTPAP